MNIDKYLPKNLNNYQTYSLFRGRKKVYIGITNDIKRCKEDRLPTFRLVETSRKMSREAALKRLQKKLKRYRYGHEGKHPEYNSTYISQEE